MKKLILGIIISAFSINALPAASPAFLENVDLHGDVRTKWMSEWGASEEHLFKAEANLGCDYIRPDAWVSVKMKASTANGKESIMYLDKAFLGYEFVNKDFGNANMSLAAEVGRNKMDKMFDSKMQFDSYFNGAHIIYRFQEPGFIDFELHGGPHVVDSDIHHYGWVAEAIWHNIGSTPITVKYSYTDWNAPKFRGYYLADYYYAISQMTASMDFEYITLYGAYLYNHQEVKSNDGYYIGFTAGRLKKAKDVSFDINFRTAKSHLLSPLDHKRVTRGVEAKLTYALTERMNIEAKFARHYSNNNNLLELTAIYLW